MPEQPHNPDNTERENPINTDLNEEDGSQPMKEIMVITKAEVAEAEIRAEQIERINEDIGVKEALKQLSSKDDLWKHVYAPEQHFLEAYSFPPYYVPERDKSTYPADLDTLYDFAPLSAQKFPDTLFKHVFGREFEHKKNTPEGLRERAMYFDMLRDFFRILQPVCYKNLKPRKRSKADRMLVVPNFFKPRGALVISRKILTERGLQRFSNLYPDIHLAIRGQEHTLETYLGEYKDDDLEGKGELEVLIWLQGKIQEMIGFLQSWKYTSEDEREGAKYLIEEYEELLEEDINIFKTQARELFDKSKSLKDRRESQYNPGCVCAKLVAAYNRLNSRVDEILRIKKYVSSDLDTLQQIRNEAGGKFKRAHSELETLLEAKYFNNFNEIRGGVYWIPTQAEGINNRLFNEETGTGLMSGLKDLNTNPVLPAPYPQWAEAVLSNMRTVYLLNKKISQLKAGDIPIHDFHELHTKICEYAIRAELVLRYQDIQRRFVWTIEKILKKPHSIKAEDVYENIAKLRENLDPHSSGRPFKFRDDIIFEDPAFTEMSVYLQRVIDRTKEWEEERKSIVSEGARQVREADQSDKEGQQEFELILRIKNQLIEIERQYLDDLYKLLGDCDFVAPIKAHTFDARERAKEILDELELNKICKK